MLNFPAILDTAADIAMAMAHLHHSDVLHGDLKVCVCVRVCVCVCVWCGVDV
jgi:tRNA A-37 threonylcarbamoyl transferase component Bud32